MTQHPPHPPLNPIPKSWPDAVLKVRGVDYAYTDTGGSGPVVLMVHGWPDDRSIWRYQTRHLGQLGFRVIALDWPGHGDSATPNQVSRYHVSELGKDTVAFLDQLGLDRVHLVAHDYGATVSWETVTSYPDRFLSYCAISVGHSVEILRDVVFGGMFRYLWLILHGMPRLSRYWYLSNGARRFHRAFASHPDSTKILGKLTHSGDQTFWTIWERANSAVDVVVRQFLKGARHKSVRIPTFGLYSRQDEWMTEGQMARSGNYVSAHWEYEAIDGGHWVPLEKPDAVNELLGRWLTKQHRS